MKYLLFLTFFVLTLFVNGQDKMGFGNDHDGAVSSGIGTVTTCVKAEVVLYEESYPEVTLGSQVWMKKNLHCTDGGVGIYSYNNNVGYSDTYGYLYKYSAALRIDALIDGWHLPSKDELDTLNNYLAANGYGCSTCSTCVAKSISSASGWTTSTIACSVGWNQETNNSTGFNLLPAGRSTNNGVYQILGSRGCIWSSTEYSSTNAYYLEIMNTISSFYINASFSKEYAFSVRLIKD